MDSIVEHNRFVAGNQTPSQSPAHFVAKTRDQVILQGTAWICRSPRAVIAWVHGYAEHSQRYAHFGRWLAHQGIALAMVDLRGHGDSPGARGYVQRFDDYALDVDALLRYCHQQWPTVPLILGAHSAGALAALCHLSNGKHEPTLAATVVTGSFIGLTQPTPLWKRWFGLAMARWAPNLNVKSDIQPSVLSHDKTICEDYANDPKVFKTVNASWFRAAYQCQLRVAADAKKIQLPILMLHGADDQLASPARARDVFERISSPQKAWKEYPALYHEILNEPIREEIYRDIVTWLEKRSVIKPTPSI